MNKEPIHPSIRQALGMYEAFRRLGFSPDVIFLTVGTDTRQYDAGPACKEAELREAVDWWNEPTNAIRATRLWQRSEAKKKSAALLVALAAKGIAFPVRVP